MNDEEALVEAERVLDETKDRHAAAQVRLTETTIELQKALLNYSAAHNAVQIAIRQQS